MRSAVTTSSRIWRAHMATRRVDIATPFPTRWAAWARTRFRTAAQRVAQIRPSAMWGFAVSNWCRLAYDYRRLYRGGAAALDVNGRSPYPHSWCA
jgi:acyl carrier protein phosphodiesterase